MVPVGMRHVHQEHSSIDIHEIPGMPAFENIELQVAFDDTAVDSSFLEIELEEDGKMAANSQPLFEVLREHDALVPEIAGQFLDAELVELDVAADGVIVPGQKRVNFLLPRNASLLALREARRERILSILIFSLPARSVGEECVPMSV